MRFVGRGFSALLIATLVTAIAPAQQSRTSADPDQVELIERATANELHQLENPSTFQYLERLEWNWGTETRSVIETAEGRADRVVLFGDEPLSTEQQARQEHRLQKLLSDHDAVKKELEEQKAETQRRIKMVKAFPKAFFFEFVRREKGLLVFTFRPNPDFSPKDRETQMYRGMEGRMWVEPVQERLVKIEGKLVKDVSFGWGIFGRLNKGGIYEIAQTQFSPGSWRITELNVDVKGRIYFFDTFRFQRRESNSHFRAILKPITYPAAVQALLEAPSLPFREKEAGPAAGARPRRSRRSSD
jgi:hypothetical protein